MALSECSIVEVEDSAVAYLLDCVINVLPRTGHFAKSSLVRILGCENGEGNLEPRCLHRQCYISLHHLSRWVQAAATDAPRRAAARKRQLRACCRSFEVSIAKSSAILRFAFFGCSSASLTGISLSPSGSTRAEAIAPVELSKGLPRVPVYSPRPHALRCQTFHGDPSLRWQRPQCHAWSDADRHRCLSPGDDSRRAMKCVRSQKVCVCLQEGSRQTFAKAAPEVKFFRPPEKPFARQWNGCYRVTDKSRCWRKWP